ncbi:unnamed protein product [Closterium sp. NIES-65]|nr:unnamed protein product [Closterium sp. NIES-65]
MTTDALAQMAVALAEASPGGVPGSQVPALLRAVSALAGHAASSSKPPVQRRKKLRSQLHVTLVQQEVQIEAMQPAEQSAAVAVAEELQHYLPLIGYVPGSPGAALGPGPGALARLAASARGDPLDLVAAATSVLRWLDGRLCWILVE